MMENDLAFNNYDEKREAFFVTFGNIQQEALDRIGRKLTDLELYIAAECVYEGLVFDIETVYAAAIDEAVSAKYDKA